MAFHNARVMVIVLALATRLASAAPLQVDGVFDVPANGSVRIRLEQGLSECPESVYLGFDNRTCTSPAHGPSMRKIANIWTAWGVVGTASSNNTYSIETFPQEGKTYKCLGALQPTSKATCSSSSVTIVPGDGNTSSWVFVPVKGSPGVYNIINVVTKRGAPSCRRFLTAPASCSAGQPSLRATNTGSSLQRWIIVQDTTDQPPSPSPSSPETSSPSPSTPPLEISSPSPTSVSPSPLPAPTAPSAPRDVTAAWSLALNAVMLTWSPPQSTGGAPVLGYSVSCVSAGGAPVDVSPNTFAADTLTTAPDGLRGPWLPDVPYTCYVVAQNSAGSSVPSTLSNEFMVITIADAPRPPPPANWVIVGAAGFSAGDAPDISLALDYSGNPFVAYADGGNDYKATVMKYTLASGWQPVGTPGFSAGGVWYTSLALDSFGNPFVAYTDWENNNKATVMKYTAASGWETVGTAGFSADRADYISLALDSSGNPFVAYQDSGNIAVSNLGNSAKATVMKYTSASGWEPVGCAGFSAGGAFYTSLALDSSGNPFVAYQAFDQNNKATVMKYTSASGWELVGTAGFSAGDASYISLALDSSGNPFVAYVDGANNNKATVMKYTSASGWEPVGTAGISAGDASYISLALDSSGNPFVAYQDLNNDEGNWDKVTVMQYSSTSGWKPVGTPGFSADFAEYISLALDSSGNPFVAYREKYRDNKATVEAYI